ncbi:hypothetical protein D9V86_10570 [Bacteroidetes/Chlorobi group bacterium ChocPot_Mid]|nr:MAG: hypothetical protein D9V86_10570 [Bacteroidetes/Chlorobi group bacterium ChocPot_Mid]
MNSTTQTTQDVKIYRLEVEDVFGIKSAQLNLDGQSAMLIGANEAGKTSLIDAILLSMGQLKDGDPRRHGTRKGEIYADFGKFEVVRLWKDKGTPKWEVRDKEGNKFETAKDLFDGFIDSITVKPDIILNMPGPDRARAVCKAVNIDIDEYENRKKTIFDERTVVGRMRKEAEAKLKGIGRPSPDVPDEEINITELTNELQLLKDKEKQRENVELELQSCDNNIEHVSLEIERLQKELEAQITKKKILEEKRVDIIKLLDETPSVNYQIEAVHQKLSRAEGINKDVRMKKKYEEAKADFERFDEDYEQKTLEIQAIETELRDKINNAGLVEGLVVEKDDIYLNNLKFTRLSKFQQLDLAMRIGMHIKSANKNGESINVLCMDASQYDEDNWNKIVEAAKENGFAVIIEIARRIHRNGNGQLNVPDDIKNVKDIKKFYIEEGTAEEIIDVEPLQVN